MFIKEILGKDNIQKYSCNYKMKHETIYYFLNFDNLHLNNSLSNSEESVLPFNKFYKDMTSEIFLFNFHNEIPC